MKSDKWGNRFLDVVYIGNPKRIKEEQHEKGGCMQDLKASKKEHTYIAIDLKSFYASVECVERGLDPLTTNLVVADASRTSKTICLAVSPSLKAWKIPGRARLFEVEQKVKEVNAVRLEACRKRKVYDFSGKSWDDPELKADPTLAVDFIVATPQMARYMKISSDIYNVYLKYIAPEDIHVYSIDEVFMDVTAYLRTYKMTPHELAMTMIRDVLKTTGITATAGIAPNLFLCKVAMDIVAKHIPADQDGVRIAELDELEFRKQLWDHRPLTDFWRVGKGYARKLEQNGLYTMGDIARCSVGTANDYYNEELLYRLFGVNAELLIDHAWGGEPCTIADIKAYKPETNSLGSAQVLGCPYDFDGGRLIVREMTDLLALDLLDKHLVTDQLVLDVAYSGESLGSKAAQGQTEAPVYQGTITTDYYGRKVPKPAHGSVNLEQATSSGSLMLAAITDLYDRIVNPRLLVHRIGVTANHVIAEEEARRQEEEGFEQLELFTDYSARELKQQADEAARDKERRMMEAELAIRKKFGKNAILKGMNLQKGATAMERNNQIGGHKA